MDRLRISTMQRAQRCRYHVRITAQRPAVKSNIAGAKAPRMVAQGPTGQSGLLSAVIGGLSVFALPLSLQFGSGVAMAQDAVAQIPDAQPLLGLGPIAAGAAALGGLGYLLYQKATELDQVKGLLDAAKRSGAALKASVDSLEKKKASNEAELKQLATQLAETQVRYEEQKTAAEARLRELGLLKEEKALVEVARKEAAQLVTKLEQQLLASQEKVTGLTGSLTSASGKLQLLEKELVRVNNEWGRDKATLQGQLQAMTDVLATTTKERDEELKRGESTRKEMGTERARAARLQEAVKKLQEQLAASGTELVSAVKNSSGLKLALAAAEQAQALLSQQRKELEEVCNKAEWRADKLQNELQEVKQQLAEVQAVRATLQTEKQLAEADLLAVRAQVQQETARAEEMTTQMDRLTNHLDETEGREEALKAELHDANEASAMQQQQLHKLTEALNNMKANHDAVSVELASTLTGLRQAKEELEKQREKSKAYRQEAEDASTKSEELKQELKHLQGELSTAQAGQQAAQATADASAAELSSLRSQVAALETELNSSNTQLAESQEENGRVLAKLESSNTQLTESQQENGRVLAKLESSNTQLTESQEENGRLLAELEKSNAQHTESKEENRRLLAKLASRAASAIKSAVHGSVVPDALPSELAAAVSSADSPAGPETPRLQAARSTKRRTVPRKKAIKEQVTASEADSASESDSASPKQTVAAKSTTKRDSPALKRDSPTKTPARRGRPRKVKPADTDSTAPQQEAAGL